MGVEKILQPFPLADYYKRVSRSARLEVELELIEGISTFTPDLYRLISVWLDEWAVRDELRIHYADLDPAVGSTRLVAVARNARVGLAKTRVAHDCWGNSGLHQEVADGFGATL